jgi:hypothetical protein
MKRILMKIEGVSLIGYPLDDFLHDDEHEYQYILPLVGYLYQSGLFWVFELIHVAIW